MKNLIFKEDYITEAVFIHRNKSYGAYQIRHEYDRNMRKAMAIVFSSLVLLLLIPKILGAFGFYENVPELPTGEGTVVQTIDPPNIVPDKVVATIQVAVKTPSLANIKIVKREDQTKTAVIPDAHTTPSSSGTSTGTGTTDPNAGGNSTLGTDTTSHVSPTPAPIPAPTPKPVVTAPKGPIDVAEFAPEFIGGYEAMSKFIKKELKYPKQAVHEGITGTVFVKFVVNEDGSITNANVRKGIGSGCDEEALRVIRKMPQWKAGILRGEKVKVYMTLPIKFQLD